MRTSKKKKRRFKKKIVKYLVGILILLIVVIGGYIFYSNYKKELRLEEERLERLEDIKSGYNDYVKVDKDAVIYTLSNNKYVSIGSVSKDVELTLLWDESDKEEGYYKIDNLSKLLDEDVYIYYDDVSKIDEITKVDNRYKRYIPYNKNIVTNDKFTLYDKDDNKIYEFNIDKEFPIVINKDNFYGIEFNDRIMYIKNDDIKEIKDSKNTDSKSTSGIAVLNYHFVYNDKKDTCNQSICHTEKQFESHLNYIKDNNVFTPTLRELEMYIDGELQLPKSVVITIDDGWHSEESAALLNKHKLNGTVFLITSEFGKGAIESKYVEVHSHTHKMHKQGDCPTGQGGGIQCLSEEYIQEDLKKSRERVNNSTYFCYPFYEYNSYSISQLKKAGFTMAFAGYHANGKLKAAPGIDKFQVPRYVISNTTTVNQIKNMIG